MKNRSLLLFVSMILSVTMLLCACGNLSSTANETAAVAPTSSALVVESTSQNTETAPQGNQPQGTPPDGQPGNGNPPQGGMPGGAPGSDTSAASISGAFTVDGQTASEDGKTYAASGADESAILVSNGGSLTLTNATITSSGDSSSSDNSSFFGQNAGVLAQSNSSVTLSDSNVTTSGDGANGVFATGENVRVDLKNVTIDCIGQYAHAVMATLGGTMKLTDVDMTTAGASSGAIATDRGGGTINVQGGKVLTTGQNSPGIYSTGDINIANADISSSGSEAAVIEGANSITLTDTKLSSSLEGKWGVMIYQSMSGDAQGTEGDFSMNGGSLAYTSASGPMFYVTNSTGNIHLSKVAVTVTSGELISAAAGNWGNAGANGGNVVLTADAQALSGAVNADEISTVSLTLQNGSTLNGAIDSANKAKQASLTLDASSTWTLTADSYLTVLSDEKGISGSAVTNITGNGHTLYYDPSLNAYLNGKTYGLNGGGTLKPLN